MNKLERRRDKNLRDILPTYNELYDGTEVPFGEWREDGNYYINYHTEMNGEHGGYDMLPIYGVKIDNYKYHIFVGEPPHKDENDVWVTFNKVPNFIVGAFAGGYFIDEKPDVPHLIRIQTEEFDLKNRLKEDENSKERNHELYELRMKATYCTFKTYLKGFWNRFKLRFGTFNYHEGEHVNHLRYSLPRKNYYLTFAKTKDKKDIYLWQDTDKWWRFLYFKKDGKFCLKYEKEENHHVYCSC